MRLSRYSKFIVAIAGVVVLFLMRRYDMEILGFDSVVLELIVSALTAAGVYQVRNSPMDDPKEPDWETGDA
jgi:hypothetical protein